MPRHPARVGFLLEDVDAVAAAKQMVGAVDPRGTRAHDRDRGGNGGDRTLFLREEVFDCGARFVGRVALQFLDPDRRVDLVAKTRLFAGTNADAPAGSDERIVAQQNGRREFGVTVADVVDVARNVDVRGARFDAGSGRDGVEVARRLGHRRGPAQHFGEVFKSAPKRFGRRLADPAETRLAHLHEDRADAVPVDRFAFAAGSLLERLVDEDRPHAAGRAAPAREALGARVVLTQKLRERHAHVEHEKALRTREARHGIALIEGEKRLEGELALRAVGGAATVVVHLPLPNAVDEFVHKQVFLGGPMVLPSLPYAYGGEIEIFIYRINSILMENFLLWKRNVPASKIFRSPKSLAGSADFVELLFRRSSRLCDGFFGTRGRDRGRKEGRPQNRLDLAKRT